MDSLAFLITLGVAIGVIAWFILNEVKKSDGALGLFAIKGDATGKEGIETARYRRRERLVPERSAGLKTPGPRKAYRAKREEKATWRRDDAGEAD